MFRSPSKRACQRDPIGDDANATTVFSAGSRRYDINDQAHGHIYCTNTKEIIDYANPDLDQLLTEFFQSRRFENFNLHHVSVQIVGRKTDPNQKIIIN